MCGASEDLVSILLTNMCIRINMVATTMEFAYHANCHQDTNCDWEEGLGLYAEAIFRWSLIRIPEYSDVLKFTGSPTTVGCTTPFKLSSGLS